MKMDFGLMRKNAILDQTMILLFQALTLTMLLIKIDGAKLVQNLRQNVQNVITKKVVLFVNNNLATLLDIFGQLQELETVTESVIKWTVLLELLMIQRQSMH